MGWLTCRDFLFVLADWIECVHLDSFFPILFFLHTLVTQNPVQIKKILFYLNRHWHFRETHTVGNYSSLKKKKKKKKLVGDC